jgi:hypothetical protein
MIKASCDVGRNEAVEYRDIELYASETASFRVVLSWASLSSYDY